MRILLDHCMDCRLKRALPGHDVKSADEMGWATLKNGELLSQAEQHFDLLLTVDQNLRHQQKLTDRQIAVVVLLAPNNARKTLLLLLPEVEAMLPLIHWGRVYEVTAARTPVLKSNPSDSTQ